MTESATHVRIVEKTPAYWRVVFDYPPFNIVDATIFEGLQHLLARMDASPNLRVVVFESANPEFYLAHFDLTGKTGNITTAVGPSGLPILMDTFVRLTKSPVVSIAKIRGCVRGVSSEFVLACDMRFASRENTLLGQPEVGVGVNPGGGGTERLPLLVGPWASLIASGAKDVENRIWPTHYRGPVLIHASQRADSISSDEIERRFGVRPPAALPLAGIVGVTEIVDCVKPHPSKWYEPSNWAFVLGNSRPLPFFRWKGQLGIRDASAELLDMLEPNYFVSVPDDKLPMAGFWSRRHPELTFALKRDENRTSEVPF
jgi:hypothetical protein